MAPPGSLEVGDRVRFLDYGDKNFGRGKLTEGEVTALVPEKGGCMVQPDGYDRSGGFGWEELEPVSRPEQKLSWDILMDDDFVDRLVRSGVVPE